MKPEGPMAANPCDRPVQGDGIMSYHCSLPLSHRENGPPEDREPCYAEESGKSRRLWARWQEREHNREDQLGVLTIDCPKCHQASMMVDPEKGRGLCHNKECLEVAVFQVMVGTPEDPTALTDLNDLTEWSPAPPVPTKQREGDQRLPAGGDRVVQDQIIKQEHERFFAAGSAKDEEEARRLGLDSQIVTQIMAESKRVGISRYGQALKTFDGRLNIRDLADELRDALVYVTKLQMTAEADKATLVKVVAEALGEYDDGTRVLAEASVHEIAEVAVDRILDWVLTQRIGPDQVLPMLVEDR